LGGFEFVGDFGDMVGGGLLFCGGCNGDDEIATVFNDAELLDEFFADDH
jgi:hypothetical protein